jgi:alpha-beta hydrolase superfamily lysophospholipase
MTTTSGDLHLLQGVDGSRVRYRRWLPDGAVRGTVQVTALAQLFTERGLPVEQHVYPDARHEVCNEINRDEVVGDLLTWLETRLDEAPRPV